MPMPHRTQMQLIKRRLVGKEGSERTRELRAILAELPNYKNGPYADIRKWVTRQIVETRARGRVLSRDSIAVRREGAAQIALVGPPNAGKSSLLQASSIQIKTGNYAFTTTPADAGPDADRGRARPVRRDPRADRGRERGSGRRPRAARRPARRRCDRLLPRCCQSPLDQLETVRAEVAAAGIEKPSILAATKADDGDPPEPQPDLDVVSVSVLDDGVASTASAPLSGGLHRPRARVPPRRRRPRRAASARDGRGRRALDPPRARRALHRRPCLGPVCALRRPAGGEDARARGRRRSRDPRPVRTRIGGVATLTGVSPVLLVRRPRPGGRVLPRPARLRVQSLRQSRSSASPSATRRRSCSRSAPMRSGSSPTGGSSTRRGTPTSASTTPTPYMPRCRSSKRRSTTRSDAPHGFREFGVQDPEGHDIALGSGSSFCEATAREFWCRRCGRLISASSWSPNRAAGGSSGAAAPCDPGGGAGFRLPD